MVSFFAKKKEDIMSEQVQENKMGIMPVGKLLMSMSIPMMISMLVQALYNVVDSYLWPKSVRTL